MKNRLIVIAIGLMALVAAFAAGQEADLVSEVTALLEDEGFSEEELSQLRTEARAYDWTEARNADPRAVALALAFSRGRGNAEITGEERARLALEVAVQSAEMQELGFAQMEVSRTAVRAAQRTVATIQEWREGGREGNLGEMIRNEVAESVRSQTRTASADQGRSRAGSRGRGPADDALGRALPGGPGTVDDPTSQDGPSRPGR